MKKKPGDLPMRWPPRVLTRKFNDHVRHQFSVPVRQVKKPHKTVRVLKFKDGNEFAHFARNTPQQSGEYYDLRGRDLRNMNFDGADLRNADMSMAKLQGASFYHATLGGAVMDRSKGGSAHFVEADMTGVKIRDGKWESAVFTQANLEKADFSFCKLQSAKFNKVRAQGVVFNNSQLQWTDMTDSDFRNANLDQAETNGARMGGSDFSFSRLSSLQVKTASGEPQKWNQVNDPAEKLSKEASQAARLQKIRKNKPPKGPAP